MRTIDLLLLLVIRTSLFFYNVIFIIFFFRAPCTHTSIPDQMKKYGNQTRSQHKLAIKHKKIKKRHKILRGNPFGKKPRKHTAQISLDQLSVYKYKEIIKPLTLNLTFSNKMI